MSTQHRYQIMPGLSPEDYAALKADIAANGVRIPIDVDEDGNTIDGFHRKQICDELGIECPTRSLSDYTEEAKHEHALQVNLLRRQLSKAQKGQLAVRLRQKGWTQDRMAQVLGVSQSHISRSLRQLSHSHKLTQPACVQGKDGKHYPSTKARRRSAQAQGVHPEDQSACEEPPVASVNSDPPEAPLAATYKLQTAAKRSPNSALGSSQVPPSPEDAAADWVGSLQDLSARLETLQAQGDLPLLTARWAPETKAWCASTIRRMQEILGAWEALVGADVCEVADPTDQHHFGATASPVTLPIADAGGEHGNRECVTVSSAEDPVGDVVGGTQLSFQLGDEQQPLLGEPTRRPQGSSTAPRRPAQAANRKNPAAPIRTLGSAASSSQMDRAPAHQNGRRRSTSLPLPFEARERGLPVTFQGSFVKQTPHLPSAP